MPALGIGSAFSGFCSRAPAQACVSYQIAFRRMPRLITDPAAHVTGRKQHNRYLSRLVDRGKITDKEADSFIIKDQVASWIALKKKEAEEATLGVGKGGDKSGGKRKGQPSGEEEARASDSLRVKSAKTVQTIENEPRSGVWALLGDDGGGQARSSGSGNRLTSAGAPQRKGTGKDGSWGAPVGPCWRQEPIGKRQVKKEYPLASKAHTRASVEDLFTTGYYKRVNFWDGKDIMELDDGGHVLWRKVQVGPRGGPSTKVEYFHGMCHGWWDNTWIIIC